MGRLYKPATMQHIDFMYKMPAELMLSAINKVDKDIDTTIQSLEGLRQFSITGGSKSDTKGGSSTSGGRGGFTVMPQHQEAMNKIIGGYNEQIDAMSKKIADNPLSYRGMAGQISDVRADYQQNIQSGEIARMTGQYTEVQNWKEKQEEAGVDSNKIDRALMYHTEDWDTSTKLNLPQLYSGNAQDEAFDLAGNLENKAMNPKDMTNLIGSTLGDNQQLMQSILQDIQYGIEGDYVEYEENDKGEMVEKTRVAPEDMTQEQMLKKAQGIIDKSSARAAAFTYKPPKSEKGTKVAEKDKTHPGKTSVTTSSLVENTVIGNIYDATSGVPIYEQLTNKVEQNKEMMFTSVKDAFTDQNVTDVEIERMIQNNDFTQLEDKEKAKTLSAGINRLKFEAQSVQQYIDNANTAANISPLVSVNNPLQTGQRDQYLHKNLNKEIVVKSYYDEGTYTTNQIDDQKEVITAKLSDESTWQDQVLRSSNSDYNQTMTVMVGGRPTQVPVTLRNLKTHGIIQYKVKKDNNKTWMADIEADEFKQETIDGVTYIVAYDEDGDVINKKEYEKPTYDFSKPVNYKADVTTAEPIAGDIEGTQYVRMKVDINGTAEEIYIPVNQGTGFSLNFMQRDKATEEAHWTINKMLGEGNIGFEFKPDNMTSLKLVGDNQLELTIWRDGKEHKTTDIADIAEKMRSYYQTELDQYDTN